MVKSEKKKTNYLYTHHGKKRSQGIPITVRGKRALAYFDGEKIVGYTTLEEINEEFYKRDLPEHQLDF